MFAASAEATQHQHRGETMPFCGKCGESVSEGAAFCSRCGAPVGSIPGVGPIPAPGKALTSNVAALLSYVLGFITGIVFLILEPYKNDTFVRFHAFQSIIFSAALVVFWIVWNGFFWTLLLSLSFLWPVLNLINTVVSLGAFLLWLFLMYKAYNGERYMIPIIGEFAARQSGQ